jgi:hypothetical protein
MTIVAFLSLLICLIGVVVYLIAAGASKGTAAEIGRIMFFAGLLAFLIGSAGQIEGCSIGTGTHIHTH